VKRFVRRARACRAGRYAALTIIAAGMVAFALTCAEWRERRNPFVFILPLGFLVNSLSVEILFARLRKPPKNPPE
jgi:hypothetical protein